MNMIDIDKLDTKFDLITDVFSSYNLNQKEGLSFVNKVYHQLKYGGTFFLFSFKKIKIMGQEKKF